MKVSFTHHKNSDTHIYEYGALAPRDPEERDIVFDTLDRGRALYNNLVETYQTEDEAMRRWEDGFDEGLRKAKKAYSKAAEELKKLQDEEIKLKSRENLRKLRLKELTSKEDIKKLKEEIASIRADRKGLKSRLNQRKKVKKTVREDLAKRRKKLWAKVRPQDEAFARTFGARIEKHYSEREAKGEVISRDSKGKVATPSPHLKRDLRQDILKAMLKDSRRPEVWKKKTRLDLKLQKERKQRAGDSQLDWRTENLISEQINAARSASRKNKGKMHFKTERGGRIGGQVQGGISTKDFFASSLEAFQEHQRPSFLMSPIPEETWDEKGRRKSLRHGKALIKVPLSKVVGGEKVPCVVTFPVILHRRIPEGSIRSVWIRAFRKGNKIIFRLNLTVKSETFVQKGPGKGALALYPEFNSLTDKKGIRVAQTMDLQGNTSSFEISGPRVFRRLATTGSLQSDDGEENWKSAQDTYFNEVRGVLKTFLEGKGRKAEMRKTLTELLSPGFKKGKPITSAERAKAYVRDYMKWRQPGALCLWTRLWVTNLVGEKELERLWKAWKRARGVKPASRGSKKDLFAPTKQEQLRGLTHHMLIVEWLKKQGVRDSKKQMALYLEWWRRKNSHLYTLISNVRSKGLNYRKNKYREEARRLATQYDTIIAPEQDLATLAQPPDVDREGEDISRVKQRSIAKVQRAAALSELKNALRDAFGERYLEASFKYSDDWLCKSSTEKCRALLEAYLEEYKGPTAQKQFKRALKPQVGLAAE